MLRYVLHNTNEKRHLLKTFWKNAHHMGYSQNHTTLSGQESSSLNLGELSHLMDKTQLQKDVDYAKTYTEILKELTGNSDRRILNEVKQRLAKVLKYTVRYGKQYEGRAVVDNYKLVESPRNLTSENLKLAYILSLCASLQIATFSIQDDIMDEEQTRKGIPCWHTVDNIGCAAINDSLLVNSAIFYILKKYLSGHHCYIPVIKLFHATSQKIILGQVIDLTSKNNGIPKFHTFTKERLQYLSKYKASSPCYDFPLRLTLYLAGIYDTNLHQRMSIVASKIGYIFMAHNDLHDSFGKLNVVGRKSTDIRNGRCSWLAVEALQRGNSTQRQLFMEHYGKPSIESENIIHKLYRELKLPDVYRELERKTIKIVNKDIEDISHIVPKKVFENLVSDVTMYRKGYYCD